MRGMTHLMACSAVWILLLCTLCTAIELNPLQPTAQLQSDACRAVFPEGTIDLSPLDALNQTGHPRFVKFAKVQITNIEYDLSYNPCSGFQCKADPHAAICALDIYNIGLVYDIASQDGASVSYVNRSAHVRYTNSDKTQGRDFVTMVTLNCDPNSEDSVTAVEFSANNVLTFQLNSRHSCLIPHPPSTGGWSIGDYIVLAFFLITGLYFFGFLLVNWLVLKREGLDLLPHRHVWIYLGLLVKDGGVFSFATVRGMIVKRRGYSEI